MIYLSEMLIEKPEYSNAVSNLLEALEKSKTPFRFVHNTKDIWMRDFMPIRTKSGRYVSFRYAPSYLNRAPELRTEFSRDIAPQLDLSATCCDVNLDGGNVVFSPSGKLAILSDRIFSENPLCDEAALVRKLELLLEARIIIIPSLRSDMTGHADGMVRFVDETTVAGNRTNHKNGLEQRIRRVLTCHGLNVVDFPYFSEGWSSAAGCYLNFLETEKNIFLPVFGCEEDNEAIHAAKIVFRKPIISVNIRGIAEDGGGLNCISWEM
ncbi:MAG: agmatine deiminase family protein [Anaerovoracaceae bacterium]|nr:agmatine deiminase family protein [Anaerovoracaceae bacterium]